MTTLRILLFTLIAGVVAVNGQRTGSTTTTSATTTTTTITVCEAWTSQANTNFSNGLRHDASKLELCQRACFSNSECDGLDWVHNAADGQRCWLSGPWSGTRNIGTASGAVTHYDFNRNCHTQATVRLTGTKRSRKLHSTGRLEIYYNGTWGTVCMNGFDHNDAQVACRMLGFRGASVYAGMWFGMGSGQIWLSDVHCAGNESSLVDCPHRAWGVHNCEHWQDVSIICDWKNCTVRHPDCETLRNTLPQTLFNELIAGVLTKDMLQSYCRWHDPCSVAFRNQGCTFYNSYNTIKSFSTDIYAAVYGTALTDSVIHLCNNILPDYEVYQSCYQSNLLGALRDKCSYHYNTNARCSWLEGTGVYCYARVMRQTCSQSATDVTMLMTILYSAKWTRVVNEWCTHDIYQLITNVTALFPGLSVDSVGPLYGLVAGGTRVTITGQYLSKSTVKSVYIGQYELHPDTNRTEVNSVVVTTPPTNDSELQRPLVISIVLYQGSHRDTGHKFTYRSNPTFTNIGPRNHLIVGGTKVTVTGSRLDSVAVPRINVTVVISTPDNDSISTASNSQPCHLPANDTTGSELLCRMPAVSLADDLSEQLEQNETGVIDNTQGPGVARYLTSDGRVRVDVYIGLELDGFTLYDNISSVYPDIKMQFAVPPVISCQSDVLTFNPDYDIVINIQGRHLLRGSRLEDFEIRVGDAVCVPQSLTDNQVVCRPPTNKPNRDVNDTFCQNDSLSINMQIGNSDYSCLCLRYVTSEDPTTLRMTSEYVTSRYVTPESVTSESVISEDVTSSNLGLIVGLSVGLAVLFVIIVIIIVVVIVSRRKSKKEARNRKDAEPDAVYHYNQYYSSPEALGICKEYDVYSTIPEESAYDKTGPIEPDETNKEYASLDMPEYLAIKPDDEC